MLHLQLYWAQQKKVVKIIMKPNKESNIFQSRKREWSSGINENGMRDFIFMTIWVSFLSLCCNGKQNFYFKYKSLMAIICKTFISDFSTNNLKATLLLCWRHQGSYSALFISSTFYMSFRCPGDFAFNLNVLWIIERVLKRKHHWNIFKFSYVSMTLKSQGLQMNRTRGDPKCEFSFHLEIKHFRKSNPSFSLAATAIQQFSSFFSSNSTSISDYNLYPV